VSFIRFKLVLISEQKHEWEYDAFISRIKNLVKTSRIGAIDKQNIF